MKKTIVLILLIFVTSLAFSQKKEKVKGSKIVTTEIKKIESFESLEVDDNLEVFLIKGTECGLEIEADDNLHDAIDAVVIGSTLRLSTLKSAFGYKKLSIRVTYTNDFKLVITRNDASIKALAEIEVDNITFKSYDNSKLFLNAKSKNISLYMDDKSKAEFNSKAENTIVNLAKNATLKALISSTNLTFDMYQKSESTIDGDVETAKFRLDNNANLAGKNLKVKNAELTCEAYTNLSLNVNNSLSIDASGKSEIQLYGDQKIDMKRFVDSAVLIKKPTK
jgi:Putative auto-transporter adhesin, head GIN domain